MEGGQKLQEPLRQVVLRIECHGRTIHPKAFQHSVVDRNSGHRSFGSELKFLRGERTFLLEAKTLHSVEMAPSQAAMRRFCPLCPLGSNGMFEST